MWLVQKLFHCLNHFTPYDKPDKPMSITPFHSFHDPKSTSASNVAHTAIMQTPAIPPQITLTAQLSSTGRMGVYSKKPGCPSASYSMSRHSATTHPQATQCTPAPSAATQPTEQLPAPITELSSKVHILLGNGGDHHSLVH